MNVIRHLSEEKGLFPSSARSVYACIMENEKPVRQHMISLGNDNEIVFFPCAACYDRLKAQILEPIVKDAIKESRK